MVRNAVYHSLDHNLCDMGRDMLFTCSFCKKEIRVRNGLRGRISPMAEL